MNFFTHTNYRSRSLLVWLNDGHNQISILQYLRQFGSSVKRKTQKVNHLFTSIGCRHKNEYLWIKILCSIWPFVFQVSFLYLHELCRQYVMVSAACDYCLSFTLCAHKYSFYVAFLYNPYFSIVMNYAYSTVKTSNYFLRLLHSNVMLVVVVCSYF